MAEVSAVIYNKILLELYYTATSASYSSFPATVTAKNRDDMFFENVDEIFIVKCDDV